MVIIERCHVVLVPYPAQGHVNPMLQFAKRLTSKGLKTTMLVTPYTAKSASHLSQDTSVQFDTISDGYDEGGPAQAENIEIYITSFRHHGSKTLSQRITEWKACDNPVHCIIYNSFLPWALEVGKHFDLLSAAFFTQACTVNYIYYDVHRSLPMIALPESIPGLPVFDPCDLPSFVSKPELYPAVLKMVLDQFSNKDEADCALVNTFYELEKEVIDCMSQLFCNPLMTIGPTIPSMYLDNRVDNDKEYGMNLFKLDPTIAMKWLGTKPPRSVVYVSFGSLARLEEDQMKEVANALKAIASLSFNSFLWVVRDSEAEKVPKEFEMEVSEGGLVVNWSSQLEVLSSESVGCFLSHCGWNSTMEALSMGVPLVAMPQWSDQTTNAKLVEDVWGVGLRVRKGDEDVVVRSDEIVRCVKEVLGGERGEEMRENAQKWKELAKKAVDEGGSSDREIDRFVSMIIK